MGVKVRLDKNISNNGENERFVLREALVAAREAAVPLMIHHTNSTVSLEEVLQSLRPAKTLSAQTFTPGMLLVWPEIFPG